LKGSCRTESFRIFRSGLIAILGLLCAPGLVAQSLDLSGIAHVAFRVDDLQKARDFYQTLGFEQAFEFGDAGKTRVAFIKINDRQFIELYARKDDAQPGGLLHICFEASDIESVRNAYVKQGLQPTEVKKFPAGNLLFVLHDPEGQLLEYTQYLPESLHSKDRGQHLGAHRISERLFEATAGVRDMQAEREFYISKLSFEAQASSDTLLYLPGKSGDKVQLQSLTAKPSISFAVRDVRHAAHDLRARGFKVQKHHGEVSITGPDGAVIVFASPSGLAER
jgi:catechol 2,3-dioxygenase-like lactoylglutathione lyase family enzyme